MREEIIGPKYAIRLGDLKPWHVLQITCLQCRHTSTVSPAPLLQRFGEHQRLAQLEEFANSGTYELDLALLQSPAQAIGGDLLYGAAGVKKCRTRQAGFYAEKEAITN